MRHVFRALKTRNYRLYFSGQLVSLIGTWMQIIGQAWLVLQLTGSGLAVGVVSALQFGPMLLAGAWGGLAADRYPKRRTLLVTQSVFVLQATAVGILVTTGHARLWMVYALTFVYGCVQVVDMPTRQAFVSEMVPNDDVMNAVSLNTAVFNAARLVGPAVAGILIARAGIATCFFANAASFFAVIVALSFMRERDLMVQHRRPDRAKGQIRAGLRYVRSEPDLLIPLVLMTVVGTFGLNFQIVLPLLARFTFHGNAKTYGWLSTAIAIGSICGAMYAATRYKPTKRLLVGSAIAFGAFEFAVAFVPSLPFAYIVFPFVGFATILFISTSNSTLQLASTPEMRGRVLALFSLVFLGSTPIGGPLLGWISQTWSPRAGLAIGGLTSLLAGLAVGALLLTRRRALRLKGEPSAAIEAVAAAEMR